MPFSVPERRQARGEHTMAAPQAGATVARVPVPGGARVRRVLRLRPSGAGTTVAAVPVRPSAVPARPVRDVLRAPGEPLAAPVKEEMEARLGADFSDVRVHTDAAAHRAVQAVSARAFTAGSHIAFQRGRYDPGSAEGRQTLAHELTHVIQQRSGPVAGTGTGQGIRVSDPSDSFERAAQVNARRAMGGGQRSPAPSPRAAGRNAQPATPTGEAVPVQRAVGFEFELVRDTSSVKTVWTDKNGRKHEDLKTDSKELLEYLPNSGELAYLSSDNGNVEYVTRPLNGERQVNGAVSSIVEFHKKNSNGKTRKIGKNNEKYEVKIDPGPPDARPQATIGVGMEHIETLFNKLNSMYDASFEQGGLGRGKRVRDAGTEIERNAKRRVSKLASRNTVGAIDDTNKVMGKIKGRGNEFEEQKVRGFLAIIFKTARDADGKPADVDPKYFFSMMPRTDFISMFYSMNQPTRKTLRESLIPAIEEVKGGSEWLNGNVLPGYRGVKERKPGDYRWQGPARRAWLESILDEKRRKDLLSPPPGYPSHEEHQPPEGIGAMERDQEGLSLFELRGLASDNAGDLSQLPVGSWLTLAQTVYNLYELVRGVTGETGAAAESALKKAKAEKK